MKIFESYDSAMDFAIRKGVYLFERLKKIKSYLMDLDLKQTSRTRESILAEIHKKTAIIYSLANIQEGLVVDIISLLKQENVYEFNIKK